MPSVGEWVHKWWYIYIIGYYTTLKRNEFHSHKKTEKNVNCYMNASGKGNIAYSFSSMTFGKMVRQ